MLILSLTAKVDLLVGTVKIRREENAMIRSELQRAKSLWTQLVRDAPKITDRAAPRPHKSYAGAMSSQNTTENSRDLDNDADRAKEKTAGRNFAPPSQVCASGSVREHASSIVEDPSSVTGSVTDDGFQLVTRKKRRPLAKVGACANASLSSIPRPPVKRALFVTRLSPDTTCEDVNNYLSSVLQTRTFQCTKLRSKHDSYSSFHVSTTVDCLIKINDSSVWPEGSLFRPFWGPLRDPDLERSTANEDS
ncbi:hypothetical protein HPB47_015632 [Ixodes persulcatus]|uniref:Uncharacterized protein n=1 Tax=Ixodes persulcatus TaxID=34615 RepID=A0AC60QSZ8_IXOPE|nr:hypothetical protein HPB47_015632 [Ixodes persulcatus]